MGSEMCIRDSFNNAPARNRILKKAWRLRDSEEYNKVGLAADKTLKERNEERVLRKELARRRQGGEDVVIFQKRVVTKAEREVLKNRNGDEEGNLSEGADKSDSVFLPDRNGDKSRDEGNGGEEGKSGKE